MKTKLIQKIKEEWLEFLTDECFDLDKYKHGKYDLKMWNFIEKAISQSKEEENKINFDIDVRYEEDLETAFDKFIEKWCGNNFPHLIDSDENDGEFIRMKIRKLQRKAKLAKRSKEELVGEIDSIINEVLLDWEHVDGKKLTNKQEERFFLRDRIRDLLEDLKK